MTRNITQPSQTTDPGAYVSALIGLPWARGGRNCWRLVREVQHDLFGREVPAVIDASPNRRERAALFAEHEERGRWREVSGPQHGAIALMRRRAAADGVFDHAGVWLALDGGGVLHTDDPHGVVFDAPTQLAARGWVPTWFVPREDA